jgi:hypothetical protein
MLKISSLEGNNKLMKAIQRRKKKGKKSRSFGVEDFLILVKIFNYTIYLRNHKVEFKRKNSNRTALKFRTRI